MLTPIEKVVFLLAVLVVLYLTWRAIRKLIAIIGRGSGSPDWSQAGRRALDVALRKTASLSPTFRARPGASTLHALVAWGFMYYVLVNIGDVLSGLFGSFVFLGTGMVGNLYRLGSDILSACVLVGMAGLMVRRYILSTPALDIRSEISLLPQARLGIGRDSAIVGFFILFHVGGRLIGESFHLAEAGLDQWQPVASAAAGLWSGWSAGAIEVGRHVSWWFAIGLILIFVPYFPHSKHIHLFFAPLNYLLKPERRSIGELESLDFDDESIEQFGAARIEDLSYSGLIDAFACIMCNRCQDVCPAYDTGKVLSPAALEINKRYFLNMEGSQLAAGEPSSRTLIDFAIPREAVWACTACGACSDICPVGNEPMRDILQIRRNLVLMENDFPEELQTAFRGMERTANPWTVPPESRMEWTKGLEVPTIDENPQAEILWWVGCAPSTDTRAQSTARAFVRVLHEAGVDFAVLGTKEQCTGDSARRSGNEYLFYELAQANVELLNGVAPQRIVTTCPHCLHTLSNEYPEFGGHYQVIHHTQLLAELFQAGRLPRDLRPVNGAVTYHDPCYLGRQNGILKEPRQVLAWTGAETHEMPRRGELSFCCGAGGAQMWKEEEAGRLRVSDERLREARATGADTLAVSCPFCMVMLSSSQDAEADLEVRDVVEILADQLVGSGNGDEGENTQD